MFGRGTWRLARGAVRSIAGGVASGLARPYVRQAMNPATPARKRADGRGKHLWNTLRRTAPPVTRGRRGTYGRAGETLLPWSVVEYPGLLAGLTALYHGRVSRHTIRDWIRGKRTPPKWAWKILQAELERRLATLNHWCELATKEAGD